MGIGSYFQKAKDKVVGTAKKAVDKGIDLITDTGKAVVNIALSPFTGGFDIPDVNVDTTQAINNATTVDFTPSNTAIPVPYGIYVERAVKNVFIDTAGDNNQYLYMCGVIGLGMTQDTNMGSRLFNLLIDDNICDITSANGTGKISAYTSDPVVGVQDFTSASLSAEGDGFPLFGGKGGIQPPIYNVVTGRYKDRVQFQLFDGSDDQPVSSLLSESDRWDGKNKLQGIQYIALKFTWTNDEIQDENGDNLTNPFSSLPRVVVMAPGRSVPKLVFGDHDRTEGYFHDTDTSNYNSNRVIVSTPSDWSVTFASGSYSHTATRRDGYDVSGNPVEILLDLLLNDRYGAGLDLSKIDQDSFVNAAVACGRFRTESSDSIFSTNFLDVVYVDDANKTTRPRIKLNRDIGKFDNQPVLGYSNNPYYRQFVIDTSLTHLQNINRILTSIGAIMPYVNGKFKLILENAGTTDNSFDIPSDADLKSSNTFTFTDDNIIGGITFQSGSFEDTFNQIKLNYTDIANRSQNNSVVWPPKTDSQYSIFKREDNNVDLIGNFTNGGIINPAHAAHFAKVLLLKSRNKQSIAFKTTESATNLIPGDLVRVNSNVLNIDHMFRITNMTLDQYGDIEINAFRHYPNTYDFDAANLFDNNDSASNFIRNNLTKKPIINSVPNVIKAPTQFTAVKVVDENPPDGYQSLFANFELSWVDESTNAGTNSYEVQHRTQNNAFWVSEGLTKQNTMKINMWLVVTYGASLDFRVRTVSPNGTVSNYTTTSLDAFAPLGNKVIGSVLPINENYWANFGTLSSGAGVGSADTDGTTVGSQTTEEL